MQQRVWARGVTTTCTYDTAGGLTNVAYSDGTATVGYGYDRLGRQTVIANGSNYCNYTYNDAGSVLIEAYTNGPLNGWAITNGYDTLLRRTNLVTLLNGAVQTMTTNNYDAASRLLSISDRTNSATYSFLANSPLVQQIVFANNGTVRMTTTNGYDKLNRLTRISFVPSADPPITFSYQYNTANQRTAVTNADGSYWLYGYDALGQVTNGVKYFSTGIPVPGEQFGYAFDQIGNRTGTTAGGDATGSNLRSATYGANSNNQYTNRTVPGAVDIIGVATNSATVTVNNLGTYRNGTFYRAELPITNTSAAVWQSITNLAVLNHGTNADTIATNIGNVFLPQTPESLTYDSDGNLTQDGRWAYTWDAENRLVGMVSLTNAPASSKLRLTFGYDTKWRRIYKSTEIYTGGIWTNILASRFVYDGWNLLNEVNATNNSIIRSYTWGWDLSRTFQGAGGVGGLLFSSPVASGGASQLAAYDGNGNLNALTSALDGTLIGSYEYGPFAEVRRATGLAAKDNPLRFSTKYQDNETDGSFFGYRYYNGSLGRWINRDPIGLLGGKNLYGFALNDPLNKYDPDGRLAIADDAIILAVVGAMMACAAAEAWLQSPDGKQAVYGIAVSATSLLDAIARATKEAAQRCVRCLRRSQGCLPCSPAVGTIMGQPDSLPGHGVNGPHLDLLLVLQSPYPECRCSVIRHFSPPLPGTIFPPGIAVVTPVTGGGPKP